ncbi:MAG: hypothetical protein H0X46_01485 [Bacteroidetes bacterium]|nr:hypothetical protein [Bacteroidota bacterium]
MEIIQKKVGNTVTWERILRICILSLLLTFSTAQFSFSQESDSASTTSIDSSSGVSENGPSISNLSKNLAAGNEEIKRLQEKARHDEIMSYIYMAVGFSVVIGIAWFTTSLAKKRRIKEDEARILRAQHTKNKQHHPPRR